MRFSLLDKIIFSESTPLAQVLAAMNETAPYTENKGFAIIVNDRRQCTGVITDGDVRHYLVSHDGMETNVGKVAQKDFVFVRQGDDENVILRKFEKSILTLPVLDRSGIPVDLICYSKFAERLKAGGQIIRARVPARMSFSGGGLDMSDIFSEEQTYVLSSTINRYCTCSLLLRPDDAIHIYSKNLDARYAAPDLGAVAYGDNLDLVKAAVRMMKPEAGLDIEIYSEIEEGTGLGGSSAVVASVIGALNMINPGHQMNFYEIANLAYQIERIELKNKGGWQDQFSTVFGGFNMIDFNPQNIMVNPLRLQRETLLELEYNLLLFRIGQNRSSSAIHQKNRISGKDGAVAGEILSGIKANTVTMKNALLRGRVKEFGDLLHDSWELKNRLNHHTSNALVDKCYRKARKLGALGGKLLGAGQSGYLLLYASPLYHQDIVDALAETGVRQEPFSFTEQGMEVWKVRK